MSIVSENGADSNPITPELAQEPGDGRMSENNRPRPRKRKRREEKEEKIGPEYIHTPWLKSIKHAEDLASDIMFVTRA